ncbi:MAG: hypothetical protein N3A58_01445 [Spirochaetes bacterium]|nr:hypothetical protein [Spirochaetota bacterium]
MNNLFNELKSLDNLIIKNSGEEVFDKVNKDIINDISELVNLIKQKEFLFESYLSDLKNKMNSLKKSINLNDIKPHFYDEKI